MNALSVPGQSGQWKKFLIGFDIHGDKQDKTANEKFFAFNEIWRPDIRICGGDLFEFACLRKGASEEERHESMAADYAAGMKWLKMFQPHHFLNGNHDARCWELAELDKGIESDYASQIIMEIGRECKSMGCKVYPYHKRDGVLRIGHLKVLHGFYCGVYASRQHALTYGSCLFGHIHVIDEHAVPGLDRRVARGCGCLCSTDMDYAERRPNTLRQANGFPFGVINSRTGEYHVWQAENVNGSWIVPSDIVCL